MITEEHGPHPTKRFKYTRKFNIVADKVIVAQFFEYSDYCTITFEIKGSSLESFFQAVNTVKDQIRLKIESDIYPKIEGYKKDQLIAISTQGIENGFFDDTLDSKKPSDYSISNLAQITGISKDRLGFVRIDDSYLNLSHEGDCIAVTVKLDLREEISGLLQKLSIVTTDKLTCDAVTAEIFNKLQMPQP
jgi:hypothetical protein